MHIKQIRLDRFTSYKEQTTIDDLSPGVNVIVGRNGAGKSNLFAAIRFVLGELENDPSRQQSRRSVVFSDRHSSTMQAWVEIVFDNCDRRFPGRGDEITVRRTSSPRADSYLLDGKPVSVKELANLLESAGLTNTNPFYIVPQGRVSALAMASDQERLGVLLSVAGATLYDKKRDESTKMLCSTDEELEKTNSRLSQINSRLEGLRTEMTDLEKYLEVMNEKHSIEYVLLQRESDRLDSLTESLGGDQEKDRKKQADLENNLTLAEQAVSDGELAVGKIESDIDMWRAVKENVQSTITALSGELHEQKHNAEMLDGPNKKTSKSIEELRTELEALGKHRSDLESELTAKAAQMEPLQLKLEATEQKKRHLELIMSQHTAFDSVDARNKWLSQQIQELELSMGTITSAIAASQSAIRDLEAQQTAAEAKLDDLGKQVDAKAAAVSKSAAALAVAEQELEALEDERNQALLQVKKSLVLTHSMEQKIQGSGKKLQRMVPQAVFNGIREVQQIARDLGMADKVYGTVAELIKISPQFQTAAERVAGMSLLNMVVEDSVVAKQIIDELLARKAGMVTFLPLDLITARPAPNISLAQDELLFLKDYIETDAKFGGVLDHVFGRVLVCSNLLVAQRLSKEVGLVAVSPAGEIADPRGVVSGGVSRRDSQRASIMDSILEFRRMQSELLELQAGAAEGTVKVETLRHKLTSAHNSVNLASLEAQKCHGLLDEARNEEEAAQAAVEAGERLLRLRKSDLTNQQRDLDELKAQRSGLEQELESDFEKAKVDRQEYAELESAVAELASQLAELEDGRSLTERALAEAVAALAKQREVIANYDVSKLADEHSPLAGARRAIERTEAELNKQSSELDDLTAKIAKLDVSLSKTLQQLEKKKASRDDAARAVLRQERLGSKLAVKLQTLLALKADNTKKTEEIRQVPELVFDLEKKDGDLLDSMLRLVNERLGEFDHVNKRSMEQFQSYSQELKKLEERRDHLTRDLTSVRQLITKLDKDKENDVLRTFQKISASFERIFARLTGHSARLSLVNKNADRDEPAAPMAAAPQGEAELRSEFENNQDEIHAPKDSTLLVTDQEALGTSSFAGVKLEVDFGSGVRQIQQLSGGQKTLCTLALIFAIQSFEPAPFYIFDEVDASLDPVFRKAVAALIGETAVKQGAQFVCTTFRPELVSVSDQTYGVSFAKGASTALPVTKETAMSFVDANTETIDCVLRDLD